MNQNKADHFRMGHKSVFLLGKWNGNERSQFWRSVVIFFDYSRYTRGVGMGKKTPCLKNDIVVKNIGFLESILHLGKKAKTKSWKKSCEKKSLEKAVIFDYIDYADLPPPPISFSADFSKSPPA